MAKKARPGNLTVEDHARFEETQRRLRARISEREARERELEEERARAAESLIYRVRLRIARAIAP